MEALISCRPRLVRSFCTCRLGCLTLRVARRLSHESAVRSRATTIDRGIIAVRRKYNTRARCQDDLDRNSQVHPLGDFYADLLAQPIPKGSKAKTDLPTFVDTRGDATKEERAAKLFGNIKGSGYERKTSETPDATWRTINGVPVPPRPAEPDNCCMSGCVHCVWDDYRDDIESWAIRLKGAQAKSVGTSSQTTPKIEMNRNEVSEASVSMDDDGGGSESLWTSPSAGANDDALFEGIPVGIREFMATEKRIRDRQKAKKSPLKQ